MEPTDLRILRILERVENDLLPSQRALAQELNVSVGLVNSFIKRLATKGYVKIKTIPRRRIRYIITPKGMVEKSRLTYRYIQFSYQYYRQARHRLQKLFADLERAGVRRVVFYGATDLAEIAFLSLQETAIDLVAVADDGIPGRKLLGRAVIDSRDIAQLFFDRVVVTVEAQRDLVQERLSSIGVPRGKVVLVE